jgi:hypothetical protein
MTTPRPSARWALLEAGTGYLIMRASSPAALRRWARPLIEAGIRIDYRQEVAR